MISNKNEFERNQNDITIKKLMSDTYVYLNNGMKTIKELHLGNDNVYRSDYQIFGRNGINKCSQIVKGNIEDRIKITTHWGFELECSYNQLILCVNVDGTEVWKPVSHLKIDEILVMRKGMNVGAQEYIQSSLRCANAQDLGRRFQENCIEKRTDKDQQIPTCIVKAPVSCQKAFLSGLCKDEVMIIKSEQLAYQVQQMYLNVGQIYQREKLTDGNWRISLVKCDENNEIFSDSVTNMEIGRCKIYNLHIDNDHSYISNGLISK